MLLNNECNSLILQESDFAHEKKNHIHVYIDPLGRHIIAMVSRLIKNIFYKYKRRGTEV